MCFAQADSPFDTLEVARGLSQLETLNADISKFSNPQTCEPFNKKDPNSMVACGARPEDFENSVITKVDFEPGQIDPRIQETLPEEFIEDTKGKKVSCLFRFKMLNDNTQMIGGGACNAKKAGGKISNCGDDFGRTHALGVGVSCTSEDGLSKSFDYSTDLYTKPEVVKNGRVQGYRTTEGNPRIKQKFISENIFSFMQDNINKGKVSYWKRGLGFINLTDKKTWGILQGPGQQKWFHSIVNKIAGPGSADTYDYIDGSLDKWGAFVSLSVGLQEHANLGDRCRISLSAEGGFRAGTLKDSSYGNASANAKISFDITQSTATYLRGRHEITTRETSTVQESTVAAGLERIKTGSFIEAGMTRQKGNRTDVYDSPNYRNGTNDELIFLRIGKSFGVRRNN